MGYKRQAFFNTLGVIVSLFADWFIIMALPKMGMIEESGAYSLAMSISSVFYTIGVYSTRNYQVVSAYLEVSEESFFSFRGYTILVSVVLFCLYLKWSRYSGLIATSLLVFMLNKVIMAYTEVLFGTFQLGERLDVTGIVTMVSGLVKLLAFFCSYYVMRHFLAAFFISAIASALVYFFATMISYTIIFKRKCPFSVHISADFIVLLKKCTPLLFSTVVPLMITAQPKIQIERQLGAEQLGLYGILTSIIALIPTGITFLFAPLIKSFSQLYREHKMRELKQHFNRVLGLLALCVVLALGIAALGARQFFLLYCNNPDIVQHMDVFFVSLVAISLYSLTCMTQPIIIAGNKNMLLGGIIVVSFCISFVITPFFIRHYAMLGASLSLLCTYGFYFIVVFALNYYLLLYC